MKELSAGEQYLKRLELERPVLETFWCWLFSDTSKGAVASAAIYSIIETAKANGLNVYTYLLYLPDTDWQNHSEDLDDLMPWSKIVHAECKA